MSESFESFESAMTIFRENLAGMYDNGHMTKWADVDTSVDLDRLQRAHDHELEQACDPQRIGGTLERGSFEYAIEQLREFRWQHATNDEDAIPYINNVARAHEQARKAEYARGYHDGQRSMDAEHQAVASKVMQVPYDDDAMEFLFHISAIICGGYYTSNKLLRDELVRLLGGVHEHHCDTGRGCACGNRDSGDSGKHAEAMTCDVLGNEQHKAVCELRNARDSMSDNLADNVSRIICAIDARPEVGERVCKVIADRLIHLLGGDEPDSQKSPIFEDSGTDDAGEITITDELRKFKGHINAELTPEMVLALRAEVNCIADRIDEQFERCCELWERTVTDTAQEVHNSMEAEFKNLADNRYMWRGKAMQLADAVDRYVGRCNDLIDLLRDAASEYQDKHHWAQVWHDRAEDIRIERDKLQAKLEEADAAIANWRERERSFEESERERDELRRSLRQIAERAGLPHDRDLSKYGDWKIANAVIAQLGDTNQYVKSLEWVRDKRLPRIKAERDELKAKLDAIREALDGKY